MANMKVSKHVEQNNLLDWTLLYERKYPVLGRIFAIPIGGHRHKTVAAKRGVPGLCLPYPMSGWNGLYLEISTATETVTKEQDDYIKFLRSVGFRAEVCRGWIAAADLIVEYLKLPDYVKPDISDEDNIST